MNSSTAKAIFLDRDGTINKEVNYLYKPSDLFFIPGAIEAIKILHDLGYLVIVITNQSGVARGYYTEDDIVTLHRYIDEKLKKIITKDVGYSEEEIKKYGSENRYYINAYYYCPHHPNGTVERYAVTCNCRKPDTGMIDRAIEEFKEKGISIDLLQSFIVGDKEIDVQTGKNSGIGKSILLRSGHKIDETNTVADMIYDDLFTFAQNLKHYNK